MSCIRFSTQAQRAAMRDGAGWAPIEHRSPDVTASKLARLRLLAAHEAPGIRRSAAANRSAPADLLATLATDSDATVRAEVARNEAAPPALLARLAADADPRVRCWSALNPFLPSSALAALTADEDAGVRRLAGFRLAELRLA